MSRSLDPGPRYPTPVGSTGWIATLIALGAISGLSIDMSLPAQPILARRFEVGDDTAQLAVSLFLIGTGCAQLIVGYLADALGRRPVLLGGLALFTASAVACACSPNIELLLACRVMQGIGAAAPPVIARAMVRDTQPGGRAARLLSTMLAAIAIGPMIAPTLGSAILAAFGWRAIFAVLAFGGATLIAIACLTLPETLPADRRAAPSLRSLGRGYARFLATPGTRLPLVVICAAFSGQFAYIAASPFVYIDGYGISASAYAMCFAATALALMLGSLTGGRMLRAGRSPRDMIAIGSFVLVASAALLAIGTRSAELGIAGVLAPMAIYFFGFGLTSPSATALAMMPVPELAGAASAAVGCTMVISGAVSGYATTRLGDGSVRAIAGVVTVMAVSAAAAAWSGRLAVRAKRIVHARLSANIDVTGTLDTHR